MHGEESNEKFNEFFEQLMLLFINSLTEYEYNEKVVLGLSTEIELPHNRVLKLTIEEEV